MKRSLTRLSRRYVAALQKHLKQGPQASLQPARGLGRQAVALGLETLDVARIHEGALATLEASRSRNGIIKRAEIFFAEAVTPIEKTHCAALKANARLSHMIKTLNCRTVDLAASNLFLKQGIAQRKTVEQALQRSAGYYARLVRKSRRLQKHLRHLTHQILSAQEEERRKISRALNDEVAQTLLGINVQLAALKTEATVNTTDLQKKITSTQRMVEKSVDIVHRFARDLRPTVLDDLRLIPALHSFVRSFSKQTRVQVRLTVYAAVEQLDNVKRTVLYRVAQEALTNVARHAHASRVDLSVQKLPRAVCLIVNDNGKSFQVDRVLLARKNNRLGLLGMRERVEMVGGSFAVESAPGKGTTIRAQIPLGNSRAGGRIRR